MKVLEVNGTNKDFYNLCRDLETFQYNLMPILKERGYSVTNNLQDINGYVLYDNDTAIGSIGLKRINDNECEIVRVFVKEDYRGNGYAKLLFEKIENLARELKYKLAKMYAWTKAESALKLYKKLGYKFSEEKKSQKYDNLYYIEMFKYI